jgi:dnd system-associated protein 4
MRSIYRSKEHSETIKKLIEKNPNTDVAVFPTIKSLQCFAALVGFENNKTKELDRQNVDSIEWHTFENTNHTHYIYLIALAATKKTDILDLDITNTSVNYNGKNMFVIFEEYANAGFDIIAGWLEKNYGDEFGEKAIITEMRKSQYFDQLSSDFDPVRF